MVRGYCSRRTAGWRYLDVGWRVCRLRSQWRPALDYLVIRCHDCLPCACSTVRELRASGDHHGHRAACYARCRFRSQGPRLKHQHFQSNRGCHADRYRRQERRANRRVRQPVAGPWQGIPRGHHRGLGDALASRLDDEPLYGLWCHPLLVGDGRGCRTAIAHRRRRVLRHNRFCVPHSLCGAGGLFTRREAHEAE